MQCPQCQHDNPTGVKFCGECGTRLEVVCSSCRVTNPPGNKFCHECGARLAVAPAAPAPAVAPTPPAPAAYTPQHLAERILTSRGALEGERKQVTVLFADLKGSLELLADRDPEEARRILDPVLERMMEAVHRYEGTVNQVMGDGIMALFGAPLAHEDHAVRACYAALRMQEAVKHHAETMRRAGDVPAEIRVGLNSGEVVVRSIGSDLHLDYTAVGQTTHLAARMEQMALAGSILLTPDTLRLVEGYVQLKALGPSSVKGLSQPVDVYELLGAATARSRLQAIAARGLTRFVGRDAELETLRRTLELAGRGHGQVVALVGEPGVGKSRLVWELTHSHRSQDWLVLESGSVSYGKATAYLPVLELLRAYFRIEAADDHRRMRQKVLGRVLDLDEALRPALPALLALLDVPVEDAQWQALDPNQRRERTFDAVKRLLLRESQEQPLLLVFEDLHWIDAETQALLDSLVESLPTACILLLVNYRPEYDHAWHRKTYYQQLRLDPLRPENAEQLLRVLLGDAEPLQALQRQLIERTEGNPLFLEESIRALVEAGVLAGERGAYRLAKPLETTQVPATVQAVLAARIDRLAVEDKRLLQAAAVVGKDVPYGLLQAIAEEPEARLREGLARLQAAEFLYETSLFPDLEYTFKHALTHEVAYGSLLQARRCALHARIVAAIETMAADRLTEQVEVLAHHALRGQVWEQAAAYLHQAGTKTAQRAAHQEAVTYFEHALEVLARLPATPATREQAIDLHLAVTASLVVIAEVGRVAAHLREAEVLAEAMGDAGRLSWIAVRSSNHAWLTGDYGRAIAASERALALAASVGERGPEIGAHYYLGLAYHSQGQYRQAADFFKRTIACVGEELVHERVGLAFLASVAARGWLAEGLAERGEFVEAAAWAAEAQRIGEAVDEPFSLAFGYQCVGVVWLIKGDYAQAVPVLERALATSRTRDVHLVVAPITAALAQAHVGAGHLAEGSRLLEQVPIRRRIANSDALVWASEAHLQANQHHEARRLADEALEGARGYHQRGHEAHALRVLGEIGVRADSSEAEAEGYYRQALARAEELGMRPLAAHCHLGLGTLDQKMGRHEAARAELATAAEMYRSMEMTFWLDRATTILAEAGAA
jgi:class 3 adenylate cyclase/tetratricopeptide (TPR) repeat protein